MSSPYPVVPLRDIVEKPQYGYTAKSSPALNGPKFLRITDIVPPSIDWDAVPNCEIDAESWPKYRLYEGDIVIARSGSVGYAKTISADAPPAVFASYLIRIRATPRVDSRFLSHVVASDDYRRFVLANATGVAQPNANPKVPHLLRGATPSATDTAEDRRRVADI